MGGISTSHTLRKRRTAAEKAKYDHPYYEAHHQPLGFLLSTRERNGAPLSNALYTRYLLIIPEITTKFKLILSAVRIALSAVR